MDQPSLNELRDRARKLHRAATAKVSRNERKGVRLKGSKYDPRSNPRNIGKLNRKQLTAQIDRLSQFTSRSTQFGMDARKRPLPVSELSVLERKIQRANRRAERVFDKVGHILLPSGKETVRDRLEKMEGGKHKKAGNRSANVPYAPLKVKDRNIASEKGLQKLLANMDKRLGGDYIANEVKRDRRSASRILGQLGQKKMRAEVNKLTDAQFYTLWNMTSFANDITLPYEGYQKALEKGSKPKYQDTADITSINEAKRNLTWARENVAKGIRF